MEMMETAKKEAAMTMVKTVKLENGQTLEIRDCSRKIGPDAYLVALEAKMDVAVEKSLFTDKELEKVPMDAITAKVGPSVAYEYREERNFIMDVDRESCFQELYDGFFKIQVPYLSKAVFPGKLVLKRFME